MTSVDSSSPAAGGPTAPGRSLPPLPFPFSSSSVVFQAAGSHAVADPASLELITQGAEGLIFRTKWLSEDRAVALKYRPPKRYRHAILDRRLTRQRLVSEARVLVKCKKELGRRGLVDVPGVVGGDWDAGYLLTEWIPGHTIRVCLDTYLHTLNPDNDDDTTTQQQHQQQQQPSPTSTTTPRNPDEAPADSAERRAEQRAQQADELWDLMRRVGRAVGRLHEIGVIHGDLTTSNLMLRDETPGSQRDAASAATTTAPAVQGATSTTAAEPTTSTQAVGALPANAAPPTSLNGTIILIDFGLAVGSIQDEDRAVDLYVLERAFSATHPAAEPLFREVLRAYGESYNGAKSVLRRLDDVRARGRKKSMIG